MEQLLPQAKDALGVGEARYLSMARAFLGTEIEIDETYSYGWEEYERLTAEMVKLTQELGAHSLQEATERLDSEVDGTISDPPRLLEWLEERLERSTTYIDQHWFALHPQVRKLRCHMTPASMGVMYYTPPALSADRPGTIWWSLPSSGSINKWREVSTVYHEGVPGHHLQAVLSTSSGELHPWQQAYGQVHGYVEGWAHEAERRMYRDGAIETPAERLGSLFAQRWRAARVIIDIGVHLGKPIPPHNSLGITGERSGTWSFATAVEALTLASGIDRSMATVEVERYLGWPAQALSFSLGAKVWRDNICQLSVVRGTTEAESIAALLVLGPMGLHNFQAIVDQESSWR
jgi:uncharacterized protein (DUF885 family)